MKIKPKDTLNFTGAKTGAFYRLPLGVPVEIDKAEIVHIDPADYEEVVRQAVPVDPNRVKDKKK